MGSDKDLVDRAAKRTDWAGTALENAAEDLHDASDIGAFEGLSEMVEEEADVVSRLAETIESRKDDGEEQAAAAARGKKGGRANAT
jgi:hypothetical protein